MTRSASPSGIGAQRQAGRERAAEWALGLVLLGGAMCLSLLAGELLARWAFRDVTTTGDFTSYFATKWKSGLRLNSSGFREREFVAEKAPGTYRIAAIGDSLTFGQGVAERDRFSNRLEATLNELGRGRDRYEVLNFGRPGADANDHVETLRRAVLALSPDFVLLQWFTNDVESGERMTQPRVKRLVPSDLVAGFLHRHSALYYLANQGWLEVQAALGWVESYDAYLIARFGDVESPHSARARHWLHAFISECRRHGIPLGIVLFPPRSRPGDAGAASALRIPHWSKAEL